NPPVTLFDPGAKSFSRRFYRFVPLATVVRPKLSLASASPLAGNGFDLALAGVPGISYGIQCSTNLADWDQLTNFVSTNSVMYLRDSSATNFRQRFYRAVTP